MRNRLFLIISLLVINFCLTRGLSAAEIKAEDIVTVSPSSPVVGEKVTVTPNGFIEVDPKTWKVEPPNGEFDPTITSTGITFIPDKKGSWNISFSWTLEGTSGPEEMTIPVTVSTKPPATESDNQQQAAETTESQYQARVNKMLKESLVYYFDDNYSKNVIAVANAIEDKIPEIMKATEKEQVSELLDSIENEYLENDLKNKSDDVRNAWKNFFNALRRRYEITFNVLRKNNLTVNELAPIVQNFVNALRASAAQELTRIQNYEVNRATYLNYMNKYSNASSKFKKNHKFRKYQKHKFYSYKH